MKGAYFLCEAMQSKMKKGSNVQFFSDVLIDKMPTARLPYSIAKAGLTPLVKILARNWAPDIRVNEIRFGYELLPDKVSEKLKKKWLKEIPMKRYGGIEGAVAASEFLTKESYITGTQLDVDGGLSL
ncbi:MAG: hypothetical protein JWQ35_1811 [Bacteriovoracaceae bacterium]|nr:hypothetical protein [Bacteriovoracaceae bacterium]